MASIHCLFPLFFHRPHLNHWDYERFPSLKLISSVIVQCRLCVMSASKRNLTTNLLLPLKKRLNDVDRVTHPFVFSNTKESLEWRVVLTDGRQGKERYNTTPSAADASRRGAYFKSSRSAERVDASYSIRTITIRIR